MPFSYSSYTGDGTTTQFAITFNFLSETVVVGTSPLGVLVYLDDVKQTTGYSITGTNVSFDAAPASGVDIRILRATPRGKADRLVDYEDSTTLTSAQLDTSALQLLYIAQEAFEQSDSGGGALPTYLPYSNSLEAWDAESQKISRVATPVAGTDAPNKTYVDDGFMPYDTGNSVYDASRSSVDQKIDGLADPVGNQQAATKKYVDDIAEFGVAGVPQSFSFTAPGGTNTFTLTDAPFVEAEMLVVSVDGVVQVPISDYSVTQGPVNSDLVFVSFVPASGTVVSVQNFGKARFVSAADIEDGSITTAKLANRAVTDVKLASDAVVTSSIVDANVTTAKIADANVTTAKIADANVTEAKIADDAVTKNKVAIDVVDADRIDLANFLNSPGNTASTAKALVVDSGGTAASIRTVQAADISDFNSSVEARSISAFTAATANVNLDSNRIINVTDPTSDQDAATKAYVDASTQSAMRGTLITDVTLASAGGTFSVTGWFDTKYLWYEFVCINFRVTDDGAFIGIQTQDSGGNWATGGGSYDNYSEDISLDAGANSGTTTHGIVAPCMDNTNGSTGDWSDFRVKMLNNTGAHSGHVIMHSEGYVIGGKTFGQASVSSTRRAYEALAVRASASNVFGVRFRCVDQFNDTSTSGSIRAGARVLVYGYEGLS